MEMREFQILANRTSKTESHRDGLFHASLGLAGEAGELCDATKKHLSYGQAPDIDNMVEELGDAMWYIADYATKIGVSLNVVAEKVIQKLAVRYPEKFSDELAKERLDKHGN